MHFHSDELPTLNGDQDHPPRTHGRYLVDIPEHSRATLVGFHGYKENAAITCWTCFARIAGDRPIGCWSASRRCIASTTATTARRASWMTKEDRELAIADNVAYVGEVLTAVRR